MTIPPRVELDPGFVLHARPYRETSLLVEAFSLTHGRAGIVARGARRLKSPWRGVLQPFTPLLLSWSGRRDLVTLTGAEVDGWAEPMANAALVHGLYLNELLMRLVHRHDPHPELFRSYAQAIAGLRARAPVEPLLRVFEKRLLDAVGYGLVLDVDAQREFPIRADEEYAYLPDRGPVPRTPEQRFGVRIGGATLLALAAEQLDDPRCLREAKRLMRVVLATHLGKKPLATRELLRRRVTAQ